MFLMYAYINNYLKEVRLGSAVIKTLFCGFLAVETCDKKYTYVVKAHAY